MEEKSAKRTCSLCGANYEITDTIKKCNEIRPFGYCGGEVLPVYEAPISKHDCLVCEDLGSVTMSDGTVLPCHRGCQPVKVLADVA
jgi:hypothetical protein